MLIPGPNRTRQCRTQRAAPRCELCEVCSLSHRQCFRGLSKYASSLKVLDKGSAMMDENGGGEWSHAETLTVLDLAGATRKLSGFWYPKVLLHTRSKKKACFTGLLEINMHVVSNKNITEHRNYYLQKEKHVKETKFNWIPKNSKWVV